MGQWRVVLYGEDGGVRVRVRVRERERERERERKWRGGWLSSEDSFELGRYSGCR